MDWGSTSSGGCGAEHEGSPDPSGMSRSPSRRTLEGAAAGGESPVGERRQAARSDPEYRGARGTLREAGGTTLQG